MGKTIETRKIILAGAGVALILFAYGVIQLLTSGFVTGLILITMGVLLGKNYQKVAIYLKRGK